LLGILLSYTYRPYIYSNPVFDFHLADTIGSWVCIPAASLFFWGIQRKDKYNFAQFILISLIGFILHEFFFSFTFDYYDLIALFLSSGLTYFIYFVYKKTKK
jgi:hypothetical protein